MATMNGPRQRKGMKKDVEGETPKKRLEIALKCDSVGSMEAVISTLETIRAPDVEVVLIHRGVGQINKSDLLMARTGSRLVLGFNVDLSPKIQQESKEQGIEIRLYDVIYKLTEDLQKIVNSFGLREKADERITGKAKVIALFPSTRKGIIVGCKVLEGTLALGKKFRLISAMGPVYSGIIQSLHIEKDAVNQAKAGQQVGLKITDFSRAKIGDFVECYEKVPKEGHGPWQAKGGVFVIT